MSSHFVYPNRQTMKIDDNKSPYEYETTRSSTYSLSFTTGMLRLRMSGFLRPTYGVCIAVETENGVGLDLIL